MLTQQDLLISELREIMTTINNSKEDRPKKVSGTTALTNDMSAFLNMCVCVGGGYIEIGKAYKVLWSQQSLRVVALGRLELGEKNPGHPT